MDPTSSPTTAGSPTTVDAVVQVVTAALGIEGRAAEFTASTPLFGSLPELDSMAVVELVAALEDRFGITLDEDEVSAEAFETVGSLAALVDAKHDR